MITGKLDVNLSARLTELQSLAAMVEAFGESRELPSRTTFIINLALEELVTNTLVHGSFPDGVEPMIEIGLSVENNSVVVSMQSNGGRFDPTQDTNPDTSSALEDRSIGGLGLHLVKSQADRVSYAWDEERGINRLTLEYNLAG